MIFEYYKLDTLQMYGNFEEIRQVGIDSYSEHLPKLSPEAAKDFQQTLESAKTWTDVFAVSTGFVCMHSGQIVGTAFLIPRGNPWWLFESHWSYIRLVGVLPEYQGHGLGRQLTTLCIDEARKTGEEIVALHTSEFQDAARHIYEQLGFIKHKEIEALWGKKFWIYTLNLENTSRV